MVCVDEREKISPLSKLIAQQMPKAEYFDEYFAEGTKY